MTRQPTLTGRIRHTAHRTFSREILLVLQVEEDWGDGDPDEPRGKKWRDARVEDLAELPGIYGK